MAARSAGLLLYRRAPGDADGGPAGGPPAFEVLLVHPGGPFWARRDDGAWSIPKGEYLADEDPRSAAEREFAEELGVDPPAGPGIDLGEVRQAGGKRVVAWALPGDLDPDAVRSNTVELEWPPRSGNVASFPEVDRVGWFAPDVARVKLIAAQRAFVDRLETALAEQSRGGDRARG